MPSIAYIRENECIGCTKCIQACPIDAIIGATKQIHTIITDECTGCKLCIQPCPVDCIEMVPVKQLNYEKSKAVSRHHAKKQRLHSQQNQLTEAIQSKQATIAEAVARAKAKRQQ